jgi:hypothetical protein
MEGSVEKFRSFCTMVKKNLGIRSESMKRLSAQTAEGTQTSRIINAISSYYEDEELWNKLLKTGLTFSHDST